MSLKKGPFPLNRDSLNRKQVLLLLLLAVATRLLHWMALQHSVFFAFPQLDERYYVAFGQAIAAGEDLKSFGGFRPMLYPLFIAFFLKLDAQGGLVLVLLAQHVLGILTVLGTAWLAARLFENSRAGMLAGALYALAGPPLFFEGQYLIVTLFTTLLVFCFACLAAGLRAKAERSQWLFFSAAGLLGGLCVQARPNAIVLLPVLVLAGLFAWRDRRSRSLGLAYFASLLGFTLVLLSFGFLNQVQSGQFQLLTSAGGINLYAGNGPSADGATPRQGFSVTYSGDYRDSMQVYAEEAYARERAAMNQSTEASAAEISTYWVGKAVDHIQASPGAWLGLMIKKTAFLLWNVELPNNKSFAFFRAEETPVLAYMPVRWFLLAALGLPGLLLLGLRRSPGSLPLLAFLLLFAGTILLFFVNARFRLPLWPFFAAGAGGWLHELWTGPMVRTRKRLILTAGIAILSLLNVTGFALPDFSRDYYFQSKALMMRGQLGAALAAIEKSLSLDPTNSDAALQRGNALFASGRYAEAVERYQLLLKTEPDESRTWNNLGAAYEALEEYGDAYAAYRKSVELDSARDSALANLMLLSIRANRLDEAKRWLVQALSANPKRLDVRVGQAVLLRPTDPKQADALIQECRAASPEGVQQLLEQLSRSVVLPAVSN
jgi:4-amino-4-deoxy-L-arabinose transferase-like glycosyltransferase